VSSGWGGRVDSDERFPTAMVGGLLSDAERQSDEGDLAGALLNVEEP
jgi:hypothetical protein